MSLYETTVNEVVDAIEDLMLTGDWSFDDVVEGIANVLQSEFGTYNEFVVEQIGLRWRLNDD